MIKNNIKFAIERLMSESKHLTELAEKIQVALIAIGVNSKNCDISIDVDCEGMETYLKIIPFHGFSDKLHFEYSYGVLNTRHRYIENGFKLTTGYYDICRSEEDTILRIKNRVRRFMAINPTINKKEN